MLTFLFWNLGGKSLTESLARLAARHQVDILMLAECAITPTDLLTALNRVMSSPFVHAPTIVNNRIQVFTRIAGGSLFPIEETERTTIRRLVLHGQPPLLLVVVHMPSKLHWSAASQSLEVTMLARQIRDIEAVEGHSRTVLVGDLNMNPFEEGVVGASGLHAMMTRQIASKGERIVQSRPAPYFYNPMWSHFGDASGTPPSTFYYSKSEQVCYFWNIFDQVLIRPELLPLFSNEDLQILTTDGTVSFVTQQGLPSKTRASDHLPILFRLIL